MTNQKTPASGLSVAIITYQEEDRIARCVQSVLFADEIIVLDSNSTDQTRERARSMGARVERHAFDGHVEQKNRALRLCTRHWVLCLDADEWVTPAMAAYIKKWVARPQDANGLSFNRQNLWLGRRTRFGVFGSANIIRLVRSNQAEWVGQNPHDTLRVSGSVEHCSEMFWHEPYRSYTEHLNTIDRYADIAAQAVKPSILKFLFHPPAHFLRAYFLKLGVLDGWVGLTLAVLGSYYVWLKYWRALIR